MSHFKCGKTAYLHGAGPAAGVHWPLKMNLLVMCFASILIEEEKQVLRVLELQLTVGYKLNTDFYRQTFGAFLWKYLPHVPVANTVLRSRFGK